MQLEDQLFPHLALNFFCYLKILKLILINKKNIKQNYGSFVITDYMRIFCNIICSDKKIYAILRKEFC
ncbi:hypothetical protein D9V86_08645 [Bacteroidetes/Chlorobi group bacterium ChocPot_Mid]|nr:MAG: hypothetical protein D9V86_08645 [Bacteroidetes/Chlorobi group bacterium ChocPot_Mid]